MKIIIVLLAFVVSMVAKADGQSASAYPDSMISAKAGSAVKSKSFVRDGLTITRDPASGYATDAVPSGYPGTYRTTGIGTEATKTTDVSVSGVGDATAGNTAYGLPGAVITVGGEKEATTSSRQLLAGIADSDKYGAQANGTAGGICEGIATYDIAVDDGGDNGYLGVQLTMFVDELFDQEEEFDDLDCRAEVEVKLNGTKVADVWMYWDDTNGWKYGGYINEIDWVNLENDQDTITPTDTDGVLDLEGTDDSPHWDFFILVDDGDDVKVSTILYKPSGESQLKTQMIHNQTDTGPEVSNYIDVHPKCKLMDGNTLLFP